ncbi:Bfr1p NDAI_0E01620 [Naumovozyma dairenensis CBS 421]|uniref:Nuclear segregation protein BFR1 n=1 Tax=Naumovozyma dairenensis (strain ATCC 10597 / BCRC 20456 / CBS 421 / NBRC 0211 / NRRL Y-12639) TaxID=1071378 RepID=G0WB58_NAUDC|nr:hypothetical protein NDAI_0E01620 [Naumovozyma dairenensis CBS 421]CCD24978.1 hypothetical protein NDAI_0E01620 [Naumovozyma dairenensis CBS 421]
MSTNENSQKDNNKTNSNHRFVKRPDVSVRDKKLDTLNVQLKKIDNEIALLRKQIDHYQISDSVQQERKKLLDHNKEIIKNQADLKNRRNQIFESIKILDSNIKRRNNEINEKLGKKHKFNTTAEAKQRIAEIDDLIGSGDLSIVEEKLLVKEAQSLNKLMKDLIAIDPIKKAIDDDKAKIVNLKEELNSLNPKTLSSDFEKNQEKLNDLNAKNQGVYDKKQSIFLKRTALYQKRDEIYSQIRQIRTDFDNEFKAFKNKLEKERLRREEDEKLSKLMEEKDSSLGKLQEKLTHAKIPAFTFEIESIENTLVALDPTYVKPKKNTALDELTSSNEKINSNTQIRKVEAAADLVLVPTKNEEDIFSNTAPSKSKKFKKKNQNKQAQNGDAFAKIDGKFTLEPTLIATLAQLDVKVPISKDDVAVSIEQLKSKHEDLINKQDEQTEKNIANVEKEISQLQISFQKKEEQIKKELEEKRQQEAAEKEASVEA